MVLRLCREVDELSTLLLGNPEVLAQLLLSKNRKTIAYSVGVANKLHDDIISKFDLCSEDRVCYVRITVSDKYVLRVLTVRDVIVATSKEVGEKVELAGLKAFEELEKALKGDNVIKVVIEEIGVENLGAELVNRLRDCYSKAVKDFIAIWMNKGVYGYAVDGVLSDKGAYMYVFKARNTAMGTQHVLKIVREDVALTGRYMDYLRGYAQAFLALSVMQKDLEMLLSVRGLNERLAERLVKFRKNIVLPMAIIVPSNGASITKYITSPPAVVEEYGSLGDLESYVKEGRRVSYEEGMYIFYHITGAVALTHSVAIPHLDIKPRNIILFGDSTEPFGYTVKINDFSGSLNIPGRGWELRRITPAYADPLAIITGFGDYDYDVYSIAMTIIYTLTSSIPKHRLYLNTLLLNDLYNLGLPLPPLSEEEQDLRIFAEKVSEIIASHSREKLREVLQKMSSDVAKLDEKYIATLLQDIPKNIMLILFKGLSLKKEDRYRDAIELYVDLGKALQGAFKWL
jgi:serine/threonine protein kinase